MTTALMAESEIRQVPRAQLAPPTLLDQSFAPPAPETVTPLHEALGLPSDDTPSSIVQARYMAANHPHSVVALARLAQAELSVGNQDEARAAALQALSQDQGHTYFDASRASAASVLARVDPESGDEAFEKIEDPVARIGWASEAARSGKHDVALRRLGDLESPAAHALRGYCFVKTGRYADAVASYRAARRSGVESVEVLINLGYALAGLGAYRKAIAMTSLATHIAPKNKVASFNLIRYLSHEQEEPLVHSEFDRLARERSWDPNVALASAWARSGTQRGNEQAIKILRHAKRLAESAESSLLPDIDASLAYIRKTAGQTRPDQARREIWAALKASGYESEHVARMLLSCLTHKRELAEAEMLASETEDTIQGPLGLMVLSKVAYLGGNLDLSASLAERAAIEDPENEHGTVAVAAYLVGEVRGEYGHAVSLIQPAFDDLPGSDLVNNLAFNLALSGDADKALTLLDRYPFASLPFHGATYGLSLLCAGRVDEGMQIYDTAEEKLRAEGDPVTADCVATRARLALRELGLGDHPRASAESVRTVWPRDSGDPRVQVLSRIAGRTGLDIG